MNVLLVEPDRLSAQLIASHLSQAGHKVTQVVSGQQAIDHMDNAAVDCIVLEPQLGVHNGVEFLYELRSYADWKDVSVVVWTMNRAMTERRFGRSWRELGVNTVLYKADESLARLESAVANQYEQTT